MMKHQPLKFALLPLLRCPECGSVRVRVRSSRRGNLSIEKYYTCRDCTERFKVIHDTGESIEFFLPGGE